MPRVSIVMPVFNAGRYLDQALGSVASQTYRDFELVLQDDGSTDPRTLRLLDEAARRPGVTLERTENRGPAAARNRGIERARGTYILPLDADDYVARDFLAKTVPVVEAEPGVGVVHTWVGLVGNHHGTWRTGEFSLPALLYRCTIHVSSLYRREMWADVGGYDPTFRETCEDWDFWLSAAARGWKGRCIPEVLAYYRRSVSGREVVSRAPGVKARLMRAMVAKHRSLYEAHLDDAIAGMYERCEAAGLALERIYHTPPLRLAVWLRGLVKPPRPR